MSNIDDIAAGWAGREDRGELSPAERQRRDRWLAEDARHRGAYARAHALLRHYERAYALGAGYAPEAFAAPRPQRRRIAWLGALAAGVAALAVGAVALRVPESAAGGHYVTRTGEVLRLPLQDGSAVTLDSASEIVVQYGPGRRRIQLLRGQALFDVAKDRSRPFVVVAGTSEVTAVGTSFSVQRRRGEAVEVLVREGVVELDAERAVPLRVAANSLALAAPARPVRVQAVRPERVDRLLAWREGMISFDGDTLEQAAAEFARYNDMRIFIEDPAVAQRTVVGLYSANDPAGFARAVALSMGLRVEQTRNGIHLRQADPH